MTRATDKQVRHWLKLPAWLTHEALALLSGNIPDESAVYEGEEHSEMNQILDRAVHAMRLPAGMRTTLIRVDVLGKIQTLTAPPLVWIEWAIQNQLRIDPILRKATAQRPQGSADSPQASEQLPQVNSDWQRRAAEFADAEHRAGRPFPTKRIAAIAVAKSLNAQRGPFDKQISASTIERHTARKWPVSPRSRSKF